MYKFLQRSFNIISKENVIKATNNVIYKTKKIIMRFFQTKLHI